jgi:hypothetical protein
MKSLSLSVFSFIIHILISILFWALIDEKSTITISLLSLGCLFLLASSWFLASLYARKKGWRFYGDLIFVLVYIVTSICFISLGSDPEIKKISIILVYNILNKSITMLVNDWIFPIVVVLPPIFVIIFSRVISMFFERNHRNNMLNKL